MSNPESPHPQFSDLQQPIPTLQSAQGGHTPNVEWLEQSAEKMSVRSNTNAQTTKAREPTRRQNSARSSLRSRSQFSASPTRSYAAKSTRDRGTVEADQGTSWHAVRPPGVVASPIHSSRSGSGSRYGRRGQAAQTYSPTSHPGYEQASLFADFDFAKPPTPTITYDQPLATGSQPNHQNHNRKQVPDDEYMLGAPKPEGGVTRGPSTASGSTMLHARSLFRDFDGTHYTSVAPGSIEGYVRDEEAIKEAEHEEELDASVEDDMAHQLQSAYDKAAHEGEIELEGPLDREPLAARVDIMPAQQHNLKWVEPPADNMVYYPAPVPMKLNRPQRLSQLPPSTINVQRRSQVLESIPTKSTQSAMWLSGVDEDEEQEEDEEDEQRPPPDVETAGPHQHRSNQRHNAKSHQNLPPQLRASVFFDQQPVLHQVEVQNGSAVATLDSLLNASAKAPPSASLDDTMRIAIADMKHRKNKSSASSLFAPKSDMRKSRLSLMPFRMASADKVSQLRKRASSALGLEGYGHDPLGEEDEDDEEQDSADEESPLADRRSNSSYDSRPDDQESFEEEEQELEEEGQEVQVIDDREYTGAPTTLLAELQLRKQELRSRNRTAATAFPNGMHSTLLELDAVAQVEKKRRMGQRTTLAWEDPDVVAAAREDVDDEDVPLAMLYPTKNGLLSKAGGSDWDRPIGLLAKRDMEESEPLSKRRNRLKGINANVVKPVVQPVETTASDESEHEGETLAQRTRRLKSKKALDDVIGAASGEQGDNNFASEVMSQFGGLNETKRSANPDPTGKPPQDGAGEEETLGQRRRRLQAEAKAAQAEGRPPLRTTGSLANLFAANPVAGVRQASNESSNSRLLGQSEQSRLQRRNQISEQNQLSSTNLPDAPLANSGETHRQVSGLLGTNEHALQSRRQQIQNTNQRSATVGIETPLVEQPVMMARQSVGAGLLGQNGQERMSRQHSVGQHNQGPAIAAGTPFNELNLNIRQTSQSFMGGRFNDGSGGVAAARAPGFPHLQSQSSLMSQGFAATGFGMSPQYMSSVPNIPYGHQSLAMSGAPMMRPMQRPSMPSLEMQALSPEALSSKQRENIDRWRQSVMH